ncbi:hypothetical protein NHX12_005021, partial [Muraenolepis orangiensis]
MGASGRSQTCADAALTRTPPTPQGHNNTGVRACARTRTPSEWAGRLSPNRNVPAMTNVGRPSGSNVVLMREGTTVCCSGVTIGRVVRMAR